VIVAFAAVPLLFFAGALRGLLREAEGQRGWLSWVAIALGALCFAGPVGFFGFLGGLLWILITSIMLIAPARSGGPAAATSYRELCELGSPGRGGRGTSCSTSTGRSLREQLVVLGQLQRLA